MWHTNILRQGGHLWGQWHIVFTLRQWGHLWGHWQRVVTLKQGSNLWGLLTEGNYLRSGGHLWGRWQRVVTLRPGGHLWWGHWQRILILRIGGHLWGRWQRVLTLTPGGHLWGSRHRWRLQTRALGALLPYYLGFPHFRLSPLPRCDWLKVTAHIHY